MSSYNNIIVLRSVYGKANQVVYLQPAKDPKTRRYPECVRAVDSRGDMILSESDKEPIRYNDPETGLERVKSKVFIKEDDLIPIVDGTHFDLEDDVQKAQWEAIKNSKIIAPDRFAKDETGAYIIEGSKKSDGTNRTYGIAELYIEHVGREASIKASKKERIFKACSFIYNDSAENRRNMCKILGKSPDRVGDPDIVNYLTEKAEKDPSVIINLYTGDDTHLRLLFVDAREKGIIRSKDRLYIYGDSILLGASDEAVIMYLKEPKNKKVLEMIRRDVNPDLEFNDVSTIIEEDEELKQTNDSKPKGKK